MTTNSRVLYAFARDGGLPISKYWVGLDRNGVPSRTVWLSCALSCLLMSTSLINSTAFTAVTSMATIGLYTSYGIPIFLRLFGNFSPDPAFNLGIFGRLTAFISVLHIIFILIVFNLPQVFPISLSNFNFSLVVITLIVIVAMMVWFASAKGWFVGPGDILMVLNREAYLKHEK